MSCCQQFQPSGRLSLLSGRLSHIDAKTTDTTTKLTRHGWEKKKKKKKKKHNLGRLTCAFSGTSSFIFYEKDIISLTKSAIFTIRRATRENTVLGHLFGESNWATSWENLHYVTCEQHWRRSACAFAHSDQRLPLVRWLDSIKKKRIITEMSPYSFRIRSVISVNYHYITVLCPFNF